ncbi:MAG: hypothetical protein L6R28_13420 [Planctomycetes bacterium]|nr:hypothetical protein [Planctomycetota bacterium]
MPRFSLIVAGLVAAACAVSSARATEFNQANPFDRQGGEIVVFDTGAVSVCKNPGPLTYCSACEEGKYDVLSTVVCRTDTPIPQPQFSKSASLIDNVGLNHLHYADDYTYGSSSGGCSPCGASAGASSSSVPQLLLSRIHRYRDVATQSSFGQGVFSTFDHKIFLYTLGNGDLLCDVIDPISPNFFRLVDGPYSAHPYNPGGTRTGVYKAFKTQSHKELQLLDINGALTTTQANAKSAVLYSWNGQKTYFQIVSIDGQLVGRVTRYEDRNGYAIALTYKYQPGDDLQGSEPRLWQIDTVTDAHSKQMSFTYHAAQVGARWAVSRVDFPNGTFAEYAYTDGFLSSVSLPDATTSTITRAFNVPSNCITVEYRDAAAEGTHRNKTIYLTTQYTLIGGQIDDLFPTSGQLIRMAVNGDDEVTYLNIPHSAQTRIYVYEGNGVLKWVDEVGWNNVKYAKTWSITDAGGAFAYANVTTSMEGTFDSLHYPNSRRWYEQTPDYLKDITGRRRDFLYDSDLHATKVTYPDTTFETFERNGFKQRTRHIDRLNRVEERTYDSRGNLLTLTTGRVWDGNAVQNTPETATWTYEYFPAAHANQFLLKSATDANGNVTDYVYDANQFLVKVTEPPDVVAGIRAENLFAYDSAGRLVSTTDAENRVTTYAYDARNRVSTITYNDTTSEGFVYGTGVDANLLVQKTDRVGNITDIDYDVTGRQIQRVEGSNDPAIAAVHTCTFRPGSNAEDTCVDLGERSIHGYDYRGRRVTTTRQPNRSEPGGNPKLLTTTTTYTNNEVSSVTDEYGRRVRYGYASSDPYVTRILRETVPGATTYSVTTYSRSFVNNAKYTIEDMTYDAEGQMLTRIDGRGIESTFAYDSRGRMTSSVEAARQWDTGTSQYLVTKLGARTEYSYDAQGNRTAVKMPRSFRQQTDGTFIAGGDGDFITSSTYTGRNLLKSRTEATGRAEAATENYTYYLDQRIKDRVDARGNTWTTLWSRCCGFHKVEAQPAADVDDNVNSADTRAADIGNRDSLNRLVHQFVVPDWSIYPQDPQLADAIYHDPPTTLNEVTIRYDARSRPIAQTVWLIELGNVSKNDPPIAGDHGTQASDGLTTRWVYDDDLTDSTGLDATYAAKLAELGSGYFGDGSTGTAVEVTNPEGEKSVTVFDGMGRAVMTIDGNLNTRKVVYDAVVAGTPGALGSVVETVNFDGLNHTTKQRVDGIGRVLSVVDAETRTTSLSYDNNSNRVKSRDPNNVGDDCTFDARDREVLCVDTVSNKRVSLFDNHNNLKKTLDGIASAGFTAATALAKQADYDFGAEAGATLCSYDGRDRKVSCTDRLSGTTQYAFDANSNLLTLTDAETRATNYLYDARNLRIKETYPDHNLPDNGEVFFAYDAAQRMTRRTDQVPDNTAFVYDRANRLTQRTYPDALNDAFTYDQASRLLTASSARYNNVVTRVYDDASRLTSETLTVGGQNFPVQSAYDAANRRTSITYPEGKVVAQAFTDRDQLSSVSYDGSNVATLVYDVGMRQTTKTFANGKVETRTYRLDNRLTQIQTPGVTDFTFTYDANKNPLTKNFALDTSDNQTYTYDAEDRLTNFARQSGFNQNWTLSLVGDWSAFNNNGNAETRTHNNVHELTAINAGSLAYDRKGNLTSNSNGQGYTWDFENLMKSATVGADTANYEYDALRRRVKKSFQGASTVFVYDGWRSVAEYENGASASSPARDFVYGTYLDEPLMMVTAPAGAATKRYYHSDHLYSVYALTDAAGTVVERYRYEGYGKATVLTAGFVAKTDPNYSEFGSPWTYTGQRLDAETGLHYYKNRFYSAGLGRFISRDPIGYAPDEGNLYRYVLGNPVFYRDPLGLEDEDEFNPFKKNWNEIAAALEIDAEDFSATDWFGKTDLESRFLASHPELSQNCCSSPYTISKTCGPKTEIAEKIYYTGYSKKTSSIRKSKAEKGHVKRDDIITYDGIWYLYLRVKYYAKDCVCCEEATSESGEPIIGLPRKTTCKEYAGAAPAGTIWIFKGMVDIRRGDLRVDWLSLLSDLAGAVPQPEEKGK